MSRIILAIMMIALVSGCLGRNAANKPGGVELGAFARNTAQPEVSDICNVNSLEGERNQYVERTDSLRESVTGDARANSSGRYGSSGARLADTSVSATGEQSSSAQADGSSYDSTDSSQRQIIVSRINRFDAEIDAKYRSLVASCRAFSRCMQNNYYDEGQCRSTLARWENADDDLSDLARELREIEAQVENLRTVARSKGRRHRRVNKCDFGVCY